MMLGVLGFPSAASIVSALLRGVASWMDSGAAALIRQLGAVLSSTTEPPLGSAFTGELKLVAGLGAALVPIFLVAAVIDAVLRQELGALFRVVVLRAPVALLGSSVAIEIVVLLMRATDALSRSAFSVAGQPASGFVDGIANSFTGSYSSIALAGFEEVVIAIVVSLISLVLWLELAVRGAAITVALLFVPLALAGVVFPATAHWARRLAETLFALVISKLVISCVIALGASSLGHPTGASGVVEGLALLLLAAFAPFAVLRLLPMVESGAVGHLEGLGRRALHGGRELSQLASYLPSSGGEEVGPVSRPSVPMFSGMSLDTPEFALEVAKVRDELFGPHSNEGDEKDG